MTLEEEDKERTRRGIIYVAHLVSAIRTPRGPCHIGVARARSRSLRDDIAVAEAWSLGKEESSGGLAEGDISI